MTGLSVRELGFQLLPDQSGATAGPGDSTDGAVGGSGSPGAEATGIAAFAMAGMTEYTSDSMNRLRHALEHPSTVDSRTAEFVETSTSRLFDLEHHSPARLLAPTVERHLTTVTSLLTAARHEGVRRRLMVSAGRSAMLAGSLAFDRGDTASAHRYWDTSISAAEATLDAALLAASLMCLSYSAARRDDPGTAWQLAHTASRHTPDDARATAWATARVGLYAARLGEREVAEASMRRSLEIAGNLPNPKPGDVTTPWMRFFDRACLLSSIAHTTAVLKGSRAAEYAAVAVEALGPAKIKARAVVLAEAALPTASVSEHQQCLEYGSLAATLTRDLDVSVAADILYEIVHIVLPYSDTRTVRELLPQLTRLNRTVDLEDEAEQK